MVEGSGVVARLGDLYQDLRIAEGMNVPYSRDSISYPVPETWSGDAWPSDAYAVLYRAFHEGSLLEVMDGWRAPQVWRETGSSAKGSDLTDEEKRELVPRFAEVVWSLVQDGWLDVAEHVEGTRTWVPLAGAVLRAALADPKSWIWRIDEDMRYVGIELSSKFDVHGRLSTLT